MPTEVKFEDSELIKQLNKLSIFFSENQQDLPVGMLHLQEMVNFLYNSLAKKGYLSYFAKDIEWSNIMFYFPDLKVRLEKIEQAYSKPEVLLLKFLADNNSLLYKQINQLLQKKGKKTDDVLGPLCDFIGQTSSDWLQKQEIQTKITESITVDPKTTINTLIEQLKTVLTPRTYDKVEDANTFNNANPHFPYGILIRNTKEQELFTELKKLVEQLPDDLNTILNFLNPAALEKWGAISRPDSKNRPYFYTIRFVGSYDIKQIYAGYKKLALFLINSALVDYDLSIKYKELNQQHETMLESLSTDLEPETNPTEFLNTLTTKKQAAQQIESDFANIKVTEKYVQSFNNLKKQFEAVVLNFDQKMKQITCSVAQRESVLTAQEPVKKVDATALEAEIAQLEKGIAELEIAVKKAEEELEEKRLNISKGDMSLEKSPTMNSLTTAFLIQKIIIDSNDNYTDIETNLTKKGIDLSVFLKECGVSNATLIMLTGSKITNVLTPVNNQKTDQLLKVVSDRINHLRKQITTHDEKTKKENARQIQSLSNKKENYESQLRKLDSLRQLMDLSASLESFKTQLVVFNKQPIEEEFAKCLSKISELWIKLESNTSYHIEKRQEIQSMAETQVKQFIDRMKEITTIAQQDSTDLVGLTAEMQKALRAQQLINSFKPKLVAYPPLEEQLNQKLLENEESNAKYIKAISEQLIQLLDGEQHKIDDINQILNNLENNFSYNHDKNVRQIVEEYAQKITAVVAPLLTQQQLTELNKLLASDGCQNDTLAEKLNTVSLALNQVNTRSRISIHEKCQAALQQKFKYQVTQLSLVNIEPKEVRELFIEKDFTMFSDKLKTIASKNELSFKNVAGYLTGSRAHFMNDFDNQFIPLRNRLLIELKEWEEYKQGSLKNKLEKQVRKTKISSITKEEIRNKLSDLYRRIEDLKAHGKSMNECGKTPIDLANQLNRVLDSFLTDYSDNNEEQNNQCLFEKLSTDFPLYLHSQDDHMSNYRHEYKSRIANIALAFADLMTLGLSYYVRQKASQHFSGQAFTFFTTTRLTQVGRIETAFTDLAATVAAVGRR